MHPKLCVVMWFDRLNPQPLAVPVIPSESSQKLATFLLKWTHSAKF